MKQSAQHLIDSTDALDLFSKHIRPRLAGEVRNAKLLYLVATSRLFARPMNCAIKGLSAIGKSHLRSSVLAFMPPEDVIEFTTLSEKALFFLPDDLAHKVFSMAEAAGSKEQDLQDYLIREIISSGSIKHIVTVKDPNTGLMVAQTIEKKGPISFLTTTTRGKLHPEIETRILTLETDDTEKQTRRVLAKLAELDSGLGTSETDLKPWHDYQRWLATGERRVVIPYAPRLSELTRAKTVRMRRDFSQVLQAIKAHALLRREQRERDAQGRIVATLDDYAVVHGLMADRLAESSEVRLRKPVARVVEAVKALDSPRVEGVSTRTIVQRLRLDRTTVWRRLNVARNAGYIENVEQHEGRQGKWRATGQPTKDDVLPSVAELRKSPTTPQKSVQQRNTRA